MKRERKTDRRVIKTRRAILDAFMELVATTPYDKITISSLAREANIDRKTFYLHYESISDLLEDVMASKIREMPERTDRERALPADPNDAGAACEDDGDDSMLILFSRINHAFHRTLTENSTLLKNLSSDAVLGAMRNVLLQMILDNTHAASREDADDVALAAAFFLGGVVGAYRQALENNQDAPFEEISSRIEALSLSYIEMKVAQLSKKDVYGTDPERSLHATDSAHSHLDAIRI